jgi:hypothetical protein
MTSKTREGCVLRRETGCKMTFIHLKYCGNYYRECKVGLPLKWKFEIWRPDSNKSVGMLEWALCSYYYFTSHCELLYSFLKTLKAIVHLIKYFIQSLFKLPPFRLHSVGRCWDWTHAGLLQLWHLAVGPSNHLARSPLSARSHPHSARSYPHSARSHPHSARSHPHSALDLIHTRSDLIHTWLDLINTRLDLIHTRH